MYDIIIGRSEDDRQKFGSRGLVYLGKHYVKMGRTTSLANKIFLDVARSHVVFVCGKRGGGKSYTLGVIAEGMADLDEETKNNLSVVILDTMGIYWTMRYENKKDEEMLKEWELKTKTLDVRIFTPVGFFKEYKERGIPTDVPFSIIPSELDASDWCLTFEVNPNEPIGVLIERVINKLKKAKPSYTIADIIKEVQGDDRSERQVKDAVENRFRNSETWGVFSENGTPIKELIKGGQITVLDLSCYATMSDGWKIKALAIGLVSQKLFIERMLARKYEELKDITRSTSYFEEESSEVPKTPLVWLLIDEAHEFLPNDAKTTATEPLITILREGRQPGISLVLASQQPGKIHTDVMTQADTVISHRITAKVDTDALGALMQSYMRETLPFQLESLPGVKGAAIVFDDTNEKMYPMRIRPRFTWHGGEAPAAVHPEKKEFEF